MSIVIEKCTKADFNRILTDIPLFWGSRLTDVMGPLHHSSLINEFGNTCFVARQGNGILGYLFGFISQTEPTGYIHLIAVRPDARKKGIGGRLHNEFIETTKTMGARRLKAIANPNNAMSIAFHKKMGMRLLGEPDKNGVPVVKDYSGPGRDRVVFFKDV